MQERQTFQLEVNPRIPRKLARLEELANNLWYSWDRPTRTMFARLHPGLWDAVGHSPKAFLRRVDERRLNEAAEDPVFLRNYHRVLSSFDAYHGEAVPKSTSEALGNKDLIAYFCAEFGFHESFPIYSGGLGILAGDHCKTASDLHFPFVGVGLLYRQGYFTQTIDSEGVQKAVYPHSEFEALPISPVLSANGEELKIAVDFPGRPVICKVWQARCGHVSLYLLDTDLPENDAPRRHITHQLYGGDKTTRIEQEIVLGVGGARALEALNIHPTVWHMNEGHAAFMVLERMRQMAGHGMDLPSALEAVAANSVFTTHTPVPAGHDYFPQDVMWQYFEKLCGQMNMSRDELRDLGRVHNAQDFNMTALAINCSRFHNGVSRIHGGVSAGICAGHWPQIDSKDNPMSYVTNGVHVQTWLAQEWADQFEKYLGFDWTRQLTDTEFWERIGALPDQLFWSVRQTLKAQMLKIVRQRITRQHQRNRGSQAHLDRLLKFADMDHPKVLTIGFGRRFATYKRAALVFENLDWLREILCNDAQPVLFLFAGKAHPADRPGQEIIRRISDISKRTEFEGRILLVEDYDMRLARFLVSGVDVWLNNPVYPLEASGTSGMKAGINGTLNLSVLDGWWDEGYDGVNGWAIKPVAENMDDAKRNAEESKTLYELLQDQVIPTYYRRNDMGYSPDWVRMAKRSMATLMPRFSSIRMLTEYLQYFYVPAARQGARIQDEDFRGAKELAVWKARVRNGWSNVQIRRLDTPRRNVWFSESISVEVAVQLNGLRPGDVIVEVLLQRETSEPHLQVKSGYPLTCLEGTTDRGEHRYKLDLTPDMCGKLEYRVRVYPHHSLLAHPFEMGMMHWL
ncbi:MAG: alpha-glucan family phosphorylase [Burkholderiales bacterium]